MPFLLQFPSWVGTLVVVLIFVAIAIVFHALRERFWSPTKDDNEVAGIYAQLVGVLYAVLLAFVVIAAWEDYSKALARTAAEVNALGDLYRTVGGLPAQPRASIRSDVLAYSRLMQSEEWRAMQQGAISENAQRRAEQIAESVDRFQPASLGQADAHIEALTLVQEFLDARRQRLNQNQEGIPRLLWWSLWAGAIISLGLVTFMRTSSRRRQLAMSIVLAVITGIVMSLVVEFEYPYRGETSVPITDWVNLDRSLTSGFIR